MNHDTFTTLVIYFTVIIPSPKVLAGENENYRNLSSQRSRPGPNIGRGRAPIHGMAQPQDGPLRGSGTTGRSPHLRTDRDQTETLGVGTRRSTWPVAATEAGRTGTEQVGRPPACAWPEPPRPRDGPVRLPVPSRSDRSGNRPLAALQLRLARSSACPIVTLPSRLDIGGALVELWRNAEPDSEDTGRDSRRRFLRRASGLPLEPFKPVRVHCTPGKAFTGRHHFLHGLRRAPRRVARLHLGDDLFRDVPVDIEVPGHLSSPSRSAKVSAPYAVRHRLPFSTL